MSYSSMKTVRTVAGREMALAVRNKGIMITVAIVLLLILGGSITAHIFSDKLDSDGRQSLVVVGVDEAKMQQITDHSAKEAANMAMIGSYGPAKLDVSSAPDRDAAIAKVRDGADAALIKTERGYDLVTDGSPGTSLMATVSGGTSQISQEQAIKKLGITAEEFHSAMAPVAVNPVDVSDISTPGEEESLDEETMPIVIATMIGVSMMSFFIVLFAGNIGARVTEEKSSRVAEIILSSVRARDFLTGKLVGNTIVALGFSALIMGAAVAGVESTGLLADAPLDFSLFPMMLVSFVLGMVFFGSLYAGAGALVRRTEDLQSTQMPVMFLFFGMIYVPAFGWSMLDSTFMQVMAWLPPFSLGVAPLQYAAGNFGMTEVVGSYLVCLVVVAIVMILISRIYRNAILNNGTKMSWFKALKA